MISRVNVLGVGIHALTMTTTLEQIAQWIDTNQRQYISMCTVHTVMECQSQAAVRQAVNGAGLATPDGMPLVWLARRLSKQAVTRVYGPDLMLALCEYSVERGYAHYFYGGESGVAAQLGTTLQARFPGLTVAGSYAPPFHPAVVEESPAVIDRINAANPDIIWVGLGTPKQDLWMALHRARLSASVLIAVGAAFNIHTGHLKQAPRWMQRNGLEWFFRLTQEPGRLWYRYMVYNPLFVTLVLAQLSGLKRYNLD